MLLIAAAAVAGIAASFLYAFGRRALLSLTTAIAVIVVFLLQYVDTLLRQGDVLSLALLHLPWPVPYTSPPWTVFTSMYLHAGLAHLALNVAGLVLLTPMLEERIGTIRFAVLYVVTGLLATLGFLVLRWDAPFLLLGASGALSGVLGAFARLYPRERLRLWVVFLPLPPLPVFVLAFGFVVLSSLFGLGGVMGAIAWEAHVIGLLAGFVLAPAVMRLPAKGRQPAPLDPSALEPLAVTPELKDLLETIRRETMPEVRGAWVDRFLARARCPRCSEPISRRGRTLSSPCGWRARL